MDKIFNHEVIDEFLKDFGENIRKIRKEKNMTQCELAYKCNATQEKISRTERGKYNFKISSIVIIAKGLEVPLCKLLDFSSANYLKDSIWKE